MIIPIHSKLPRRYDSNFILCDLSSPSPSKIGVPRGSILAPLLFLNALQWAILFMQHWQAQASLCIVDDNN